MLPREDRITSENGEINPEDSIGRAEPAKACFKCGDIKPLSEFYTHKAMADGHLNKCKHCARSDARSYFEKEPEKYRAKKRDAVVRRLERPGVREKDAAVRRARLRASPEARRALNARTAVRRALRLGRLRRMQCEVCGDPDTQAHHDDYSRPLDVRWLCYHHHCQAHGKLIMLGDAT